MTDAVTGGCLCGAVRFTATGAATRAGLCHCRDCQRAHAAPAYHFIVYPAGSVAIEGTLTPRGTVGGYDRAHCATCGSHAVAFVDDEVELSGPCFDDPRAAPAPQYELWTIRRLSWLAPLDVPQYDRNREG